MRPRLARKARSARPHRPAAPHIRPGEGPQLKTHLGLPQDHIGPVALTIGSYDGVHLGHLDVIGHAVRGAGEVGGQSALITFEPHPRCV
ncbi:MAG TPA: hypothetical protein VGX22_08780, partial [Candidatus Dormibacteraeota bacterium]|nr:hypothetical protein [Candidatus Dormibacteraeota bacterium]